MPVVPQGGRHCGPLYEGISHPAPRARPAEVYLGQDPEVHSECGPRMGRDSEGVRPRKEETQKGKRLTQGVG